MDVICTFCTLRNPSFTHIFAANHQWQYEAGTRRISQVEWIHGLEWVLLFGKEVNGFKWFKVGISVDGMSWDEWVGLEWVCLEWVWLFEKELNELYWIYLLDFERVGMIWMDLFHSIE